jgi:hypothetical protein
MQILGRKGDTEMKNLKTFICFTWVLFALFAYAGRAQARDISGNIPSTLTIFDDSRLVGDVNCTDALLKALCIAFFGAGHIDLNLNGHTITGPVDPPTNCSLPTDVAFGVGTSVNGRQHVKIEGPGVIQNFQRWGIVLSSSTHVTVKDVTVNRNCWSGMQTFSTSDSNFEGGVSVNNAAGSNGSACGGICLVNTNKNVIHKCTFSGNGKRALFIDVLRSCKS